MNPQSPSEEVISAQYLYEPIMEGAVFQEKRCNVKRVPSVRQVSDFLDLFQFGSRWHAWNSTGFFCGLRPCEIAQLTTDDVIIVNGRWCGLRYKVGKPRPPGRMPSPPADDATDAQCLIYKAKLDAWYARKKIRKWNRIDEMHGDIPVGALHSLQMYWRHHHQKVGLLFPKAYSQYGKVFSMARARMVAMGHKNWSTTQDDYFHRLPSSDGAERVEHDITPYSARRFFISCYHWLVSSENRNGVPDLLQTQKRVAHSTYKDTATYVYSWRELGLQSDDIGKGWAILLGVQPSQTRLNEFWIE